MRKLIVLIILLTGAILYYACKKDTAPHEADPGIRDKINSWLDSQKSEKHKKKNDVISLLGEQLDYPHARYEPLNKDHDLLVLPVKEGFRKKMDIDGNSLLNLVLFLNKSGQIKYGYVAVHLPNSSLQELPSGSFSKIFNYRETGLEGQVKFLTVTGNRVFRLEFRDGKLNSYARVRNKQKQEEATSNKGTDMECTEWYLVTTYYEDGLVVNETADFIGITCTDSGGECDDLAFDDICLSESGGGSAADICCLTEADFQLTSNPVSISDGVDCGQQGKDPATGLLTKTCTYTWTFAKNSMAWYDWDYKSIETGSLVNINGVWKFRSVGHTGKLLYGTTPPCVDVTWDISSATPSISGDQMQAQISLQYWTTCKVSCIPYAPPKTLNGASYTLWKAPQG